MKTNKKILSCLLMGVTLVTMPEPASAEGLTDTAHVLLVSQPGFSGRPGEEIPEIGGPLAMRIPSKGRCYCVYYYKDGGRGAHGQPLGNLKQGRDGKTFSTQGEILTNDQNQTKAQCQTQSDKIKAGADARQQRGEKIIKNSPKDPTIYTTPTKPGQVSGGQPGAHNPGPDGSYPRMEQSGEQAGVSLGECTWFQYNQQTF